MIIICFDHSFFIVDDSVNLGYRLRQMSRVGGSPVLASRSTDDFEKCPAFNKDIRGFLGCMGRNQDKIIEILEKEDIDNNEDKKNYDYYLRLQHGGIGYY